METYFTQRKRCRTTWLHPHFPKNVIKVILKEGVCQAWYRSTAHYEGFPKNSQVKLHLLDGLIWKNEEREYVF